MGRLDLSEGTTIGEREGAFIIAEAGVNHGGDLDRAKTLVEVAAKAGADAVKFQTFQTDKLVTESAEKADYQKDDAGEQESQRDMLERLELAPGMHDELQAECEKHGIIFLSSPFDRDSADLLEQLEVPAFKVGSGELTNLPFLTHLAAKQRPMIVSSGMSNLGELEEAVCTIEEEGNDDIVLMHCVSNYPASPSSTNLRAIDTISRAFGYPTGLSDHTMGIEIPIAAVARGADIIEKHFTLDRQLPGPDHEASLEPDELEHMIEGIWNVEAALGDGRKRPVSEEKSNAERIRKSIVVVDNIEQGTVITREMLAIRRPGTGLKPSMLKRVVGRTATTDIQSETLISLDMLE